MSQEGRERKARRRATVEPSRSRTIPLPPSVPHDHPPHRPMSLSFDPPSSTPSSSPFDGSRRAVCAGFAIAIPITITMTKEPRRGLYLRTSLSFSFLPPLYSTQAGRPGGVYIMSPLSRVPGSRGFTSVTYSHNGGY
jgi:hypothetical protein